MKRSIKRSNRSKKNNHSKKSNRYRKRISRRRSRRNRRISRKYKRRSRKRISRKKRRSRRKSMKGGEMSGLQKIGMGAGAVAGAVAGGLVGKAVGGDKVKLATTLGGVAVGTGIGAGVTKLISSMGNKIYATQVNITKNTKVTDKYDPEYTGSLKKERLQEIFDRECPYDRDVFNKLFSPLQQKLQDMTGNPRPKLFGKNDSIWNSNDNNSRTFLHALITRCIYVRSNSNTLIISVITGNYLHNGNHLIFTEVIPSYYLVTDMKACILQKTLPAFSQYAEISKNEIDDNKCPERKIISDLHQEPELHRWIIPEDVSVNIIT